jgi:RNA polymerase sigma-70 factor, ECF subfamily
MRDAVLYAGSMDAGEATGFAASKTHDPDAIDVARYQAGNMDAFESLVSRHERAIYQVCARMLPDREDAMDAVQDTFLRVYRALGAFRGDAAFRTWLIGIALNVCRNRIASAAERNRKVTSSITQEDPENGEARDLDLRDSAPDPESAAMGHELRSALDRALGSLAPEHREILVLREIQDMEYEELAQVLSCPVGTVKSRLCRARQALRVALVGIWP